MKLCCMICLEISRTCLAISIFKNLMKYLKCNPVACQPKVLSAETAAGVFLETDVLKRDLSTFTVLPLFQQTVSVWNVMRAALVCQVY